MVDDAAVSHDDAVCVAIPRDSAANEMATKDTS
jgi:hypothetical protein